MNFRWNTITRVVLFFFSSTSIWCLLAEFYGLCPMRTFALWVLLPSTMGLLGIFIQSARLKDLTLFRSLLIGSGIGMMAALAYDVFRVPFVLAYAYQYHSVIPALPLFKVFPRFGAMLLGEPVNQDNYSILTQTVGWAYHFSNAITFGIMYMAMIGDPLKKSWLWAVILAVGLEIAMLTTPYTGFFGIKVGLTFIIVTLTAHLIFGVVLGRGCKASYRKWLAHA
jgi:hypothetical protein